MTLSDITREIAADHMATYATEGRLVQGSWHWRGNDGRDLACLLGSIDPEIDDISKCPASVMPQWMAELLVTLFDGVRADVALDYGLRFADALRRGNTDESVLRRWLVITVEDAVRSATPKGEPPAYWRAVSDACANVCNLLRGNAPKSELVKAARAAAAEAAWAAARAAAAEAAWAARAAARAGAARAAARAGAARAAAAEAAWAAARAARAADRSATYERLFDALIAEMLRGVP